MSEYPSMPEQDACLAPDPRMKARWVMEVAKLTVPNNIPCQSKREPVCALISSFP